MSLATNPLLFFLLMCLSFKDAEWSICLNYHNGKILSIGVLLAQKAVLISHTLVFLCSIFVIGVPETA